MSVQTAIPVDAVIQTASGLDMSVQTEVMEEEEEEEEEVKEEKPVEQTLVVVLPSMVRQGLIPLVREAIASTSLTIISEHDITLTPQV